VIDYVKVYTVSDSAGRITIVAEDAEGYGTGHQLAGPRPSEGPIGDILAKREWDAQDVVELRHYLGSLDDGGSVRIMSDGAGRICIESQADRRVYRLAGPEGSFGKKLAKSKLDSYDAAAVRHYIDIQDDIQTRKAGEKQ
jgi:hypothetical protein